MSHLEVGLRPKVRIAARHREKFLNLLAVAIAVLSLLVRLSASLEEPMVDDRSPTAKAMAIVSQITSIGIALVLPTIAGRGFDVWLGTGPALLLVGIALGFLVAGFQFFRLIKRLEKDTESKTN